MPGPVIGYGSASTPFNEAFGRIVEVGWGGTVKWPTMPFSYLEKSGAASPLLTDSLTGTASFWFRINNGTMPAPDGGQAVFPIVYVPGPRVFDTFTYAGATEFDAIVTANTADRGLIVWVFRDAFAGLFGIQVTLDRQIGQIWYQATMNTMQSISGPSSLADDLCNEKWAHFKVTWDFVSGTGTVTANKIDQTLYYHNFSYDWDKVSDPFSGGPEGPYAASYVPWGGTPRFFGARVFYSDVISGPADVTIGPIESLSENHLVSLAQVWVDPVNIITDVAKFVTADNKPAALGPNGEFLIDDPSDPTKKIPDPTTEPAYYFKAGPATFVQNKGTGGTTALIGAPPISQSVPVVIGS